MSLRVPKTRVRLAELEQLGLWHAPRQAHDVIEAAVELDPLEPTALVHGDLHLRHLLVDDVGRATAVIDRIDLSAPADVILDRVARRTTNRYGKTPVERAMILDDLARVEPLLRASCTHELDASRPLSEVVADLIAIASGP